MVGNEAHTTVVFVASEAAEVASSGSGESRADEPNFWMPIGSQSANPWHNSSNPLDVNGEDGVTLLDVLAVINRLNVLPPETPLEATREPSAPFYDVNNDGICSPLDALLVINYLEDSSVGTAEGEASPVGSRNKPLELDAGAVTAVALASENCSVPSTHESTVSAGSSVGSAHETSLTRESRAAEPRRTWHRSSGDGRTDQDRQKTLADLENVLPAIAEDVAAARLSDPRQC
jgi:hypothetical protein